MPDASGKIAPIHTLLDRHGRSLQEWVKSVRTDEGQQSCSTVVFTNPIVLPIRTHQRMCYPSYCVSMLGSTHEVPVNSKRLEA